MSKEKKLSKEELIGTLDFCKKMYASRLRALEPSNSHKRLQAQFDKRIYQIKSLTESSAEEPSEAEVEEFVEKWNDKFAGRWEHRELLPKMLKEYRELLRRRR